MKILLLSPKSKGDETGGVKVDAITLDELTQIQDIEVVDPIISIYNRTTPILIVLKKLLQQIRKGNFDLLVAGSRLYPRLFWLLLLCRILHVKFNLVLIHHHFDYLAESGLRRFLKRILEMYCLRQCSYVLCHSTYIYNLLITKLPLTQSVKIDIPFDHSKPIMADPSVEKKVNLLFVGNIDPRKGIIDLVEVAKLLRDQYSLSILTRIVGGTLVKAYKDAIVSLINQYDLENEVMLEGRLPDDELMQRYATASLFVFPTRHEGFGMVVMEAMKYGLPVITYHNSAMPFSIKNGVNGFCVENGNCSAMANAINTVLQEPLLYAKLQQGAYKTFEDTKTVSEFRAAIRDFFTHIQI